MDSYDRFLRKHADDETRLAASHHSAVICLATDVVPVIYVSDAFEAHTGYKPSEVIGKSLAILQGPMTEAQAIDDFRFLIKNGVAGTVRITNYRKDKTPFVHECALRPIRSADGVVSHFIAIQTPLPE